LTAQDYFRQQVDEHRQVVELARERLAEPFEALVRLALAALRADRKLLFFGNGGSAADAQHFAAELVVRYRQDRRAFPAIALTTDTSALTAAGNDLGFERIFARQIEALGRPGDVAIGSSTSGRSRNVIEALRTARGMGLKTAALTGHDGGELAELADVLVAVPSEVTARIQEVHLLVGHLLCGVLERELISHEVRS